MRPDGEPEHTGYILADRDQGPTRASGRSTPTWPSGTANPSSTCATPIHLAPASWLPRHETREARQEGALKLRRYFRRLGRTPFDVLPLARETPTLAELLRLSHDE